jgi:hypothetical protein
MLHIAAIHPYELVWQSLAMNGLSMDVKRTTSSRGLVRRRGRKFGDFQRESVSRRAQATRPRVVWR